MTQQLILIFVLCFIVRSTTIFPPYVWMYWNGQFKSMPNFFKECLANNQRILQNTKWEIKFVTFQTLPDYFNASEFQQIAELLSNITIIQQKADLIRLLLLQKYGGVYLDISGYLVQNLDWLDHLKENQHQMYKINHDIQFFMFQSLFDIQNLLQSKKQISKHFLFENAFIAAVKNANFVNDWLNRLIFLLRQQAQKQKSYFLAYGAYFEIIGEKISEIEQKQGSQFGTFYEAYKMGTISVIKGFYASNSYFELSRWQQVSTKFTELDLKESFNFTWRYYKKQNHYSDQFFRGYFDLNQTEIKIAQQSYYPLYTYISQFITFPSFMTCLGQMYFIENSLMFNLFLKNNTKYLSQNNHRIYKESEVPWICRYNHNFQKLLVKIFAFFFIFYIYSLYICLAKKNNPKDDQSYELVADTTKNSLDNDEERINEQVNNFKMTSFEVDWEKFEKNMFCLLFGIDCAFKMLLLFRTTIEYPVGFSVTIKLILMIVCHNGRSIKQESFSFLNYVFSNIIFIALLWVGSFFDRLIIKQESSLGNSFYQISFTRILLIQNFIAKNAYLGYTFFKIIYLLKIIRRFTTKKIEINI